MKGQHLLIDAFECNLEKINNKKLIRRFLNTLVEKINMELLSPVKVYRAKKGEAEGVSSLIKGSNLMGGAIITTSHISIHTFTADLGFWMDVFSCKDFDEEKVIDLVEKEFECKTNTQSIERGFK